MSERTELQQKVIDRAKEMLSKYDWFQGGVCLDYLWNDQKIQMVGIEKNATELVMDTAYWDAPDFTNWFFKGE